MDNLFPKGVVNAINQRGVRPRCPPPGKEERSTPPGFAKFERHSVNGVGWAGVQGSDVINFLEAGISRRTTPIEKAAIAAIFNLRICGSDA